MTENHFLLQNFVVTRLEVCVDSLESAINALNGGANELEVCSSLTEGGLTPSPGLVAEITTAIKEYASSRKLPNSDDPCRARALAQIPKLNVMIRCRGGSDFCYSEHEMKTMIADIKVYKEMFIDRFVFGALTANQEIDTDNCSRIIEAAMPIPVTFHRAFDVSSNPERSIENIINLGFDRLLTSGQELCADDKNAVELIKVLHDNYGDKIDIMPGAGVNVNNASIFVSIGCKIVHSSCKRNNNYGAVSNALGMGSCGGFVTDENKVQEMVYTINN